jgi:phosphinothricin acetyltransferase
VVGYAYAGKHRERAAYRWSVDLAVYVSRAIRRRGVGRALYVPLLTTLRLQGFRSAVAEIALPNAGSIRLHESMGFVHVGTHLDAGFKLGQWRDVGYWRLALSCGSVPNGEPCPFSVFRNTPDFAAILSGQADCPATP